MPSVFAKVEKQNSLESGDPLKQVQSLVEKKIRNLEKRKGKLEQLKEEQSSGKALHDDQKKAIKRFDEVIEMLDFFKEFSKNVATIFAEHSKLMKKQMKKEQLERQQQEAEKLKTVLLFQDILNTMGTEETRQDFLKGTNGAIQLNDEKLSQLDELYKLVIPDRSREDEPFSKQLDSAGERWLALVEGKNREAVKGGTYKDLKELLTSISVCGYFDSSAKAETKEEKEGQGGDVPSSVVDQTREVSLLELMSAKPTNDQLEQETDKYKLASGVKSKGGVMNNLVAQMADNQSVTSGFNFLQESRLDAAPHMDPAVVALAPVAGSYSNQFSSSAIGAQNTESSANQMASQMTLSSTSTQKAATTYDTINSHQPIPTQTFTNQNFAAMMGPTFTVPTLTISSALGLPVQHIPVQSISPHHTPSPDMISVQDVNQQNQQLMNQQVSQQQVTNYQDTSFNNYQIENRTETNTTSQENNTTFNEESGGYGQNQGSGQGYNRNYRGRGGRGGNRGTSINGHNRSSTSGRTGNRGYQSSFGNNNFNSSANGPYFGNSDKRNVSNANNQHSGNKGGTQANRAGGRSAAGVGSNRNAGGNYSNK